MAKIAADMAELAPAEAAAVFGEDGPLAAMQGYVRRPGQAAMAKEVAAALFAAPGKRRHLLVDAGTGIGKTFAYLVPAILSGAKVIVATSTKALQDQIVKRDFPQLAELLGSDAKACALKGIGNYVCLKRFEETKHAAEEGKDGLLDGGRAAGDFAKVAEKVARADFDGDVSGVAGVKKFAKVWPLVTATSSQCERRDCDHYQRSCYYYRKVREAREAQLLVLSHALYFAASDIPKEDYAACIFDEGHGVAEKIHHLVGVSLSLASLESFFEDLRRRGRLNGLSGGPEQEEGWKEKLEDLAAGLLERADAAKESLLDTADKIAGAAELLAAEDGLEAALGDLEAAAAALRAHLGAAAERHVAIKKVEGVCKEAEAVLEAWLVKDEGASSFGWLERTEKNVVMRCAPQNPAKAFRAQALDSHPVALCSATMAWEGDFDPVQRLLGMEDAATLTADSPFDFGRNGLLHLPRLKAVPRPGGAGAYIEEVAELGARLAEASGGGAFMLFAAKRDLDAATRLLRPRLAGSGIAIVNQYDGDPQQLIDRHFRADGGAGKLLLGIRTFWQGVDVPGRALRLVIIDRIPFIPPSDPVLQARERVLEREHPDARPFEHLQLYPAAMLLKQAVGRLLRGEDDRGVAVLCDPRLRSKGYGARILASLQPLRREDGLAKAIAFLKEVSS